MLNIITLKTSRTDITNLVSTEDFLHESIYPSVRVKGLTNTCDNRPIDLQIESINS